MNYHEAVFLEESVQGLNIKPEGIYVDATYGGGGHSKEILKKIKTGRLLAFDQDPDVIPNAASNTNFILIKQNFRYLKECLKLYNIEFVDGLLADLGISSHQINTPERGFSTRFEGELDMRMSTQGRITAKEILNTYTEARLQKIFSTYGEISNAKRLAKSIAVKRQINPLNTINELKEAIGDCVIKHKANQYYAQVFQALRIEVNDELNALKDLLTQSAEALIKGGRLVVISYHSLEDRLVKNFINKGRFEGEAEKDIYGNSPALPYRAINKKPITPTKEELARNPRSRSAKLRIAEKII